MMNNSFLHYCATVDTPSIVYNKDLLMASVNKIKKLKKLSKNLFVYYAIKANSNEKICKVISQEVDGADVASISELEVALKSEFKNISFNSPNIPFENLKNFNLSNVNLCFNSLSQLEQGVLSGLTSGRVTIRLNYFIQNEINNHRIKSRFGIDVTENNLNELITTYNLTISGIHVHIEEKNIESVKEILKFIDDLLRQESYRNVEIINIGGGFLKILANQISLDIVQSLLRDFCDRHSSRKIIIEPGNAFVRSSAVLVTEVNSVDIVRDKEYYFRNIVVDSSAYNLLSWTRVQLISSTSKSTEKEYHNIYGNTCYEFDIFSEKCYTNKISVGDKILFYPVGAYVENNSKQLHMFSFPEIHYFGFKEE